MRYPSVIWAEREEFLFVTFNLQDACEVKVILEDRGFIKFSAKGVSGDDYECELELFGEIVRDETKILERPRDVFLKIKKKVDDKYWNKLTKDKKPHFVSIDWNRWLDEDDDSEKLDSIDPRNLSDYNMPDFGDYGLGEEDEDLDWGEGEEKQDEDEEEKPPKSEETPQVE